MRAAKLKFPPAPPKFPLAITLPRQIALQRMGRCPEDTAPRRATNIALQRMGRCLSPEALAALESACGAASGGSQVKAAAALGVSSAVVNQLLKGKYPGDVGRMETKIRGELLRETVPCPVMGDLDKRSCLDYQRLDYAATNPRRHQLHRTCPLCPHREKKDTP